MIHAIVRVSNSRTNDIYGAQSRKYSSETYHYATMTEGSTFVPKCDMHTGLFVLNFTLNPEIDKAQAFFCFLPRVELVGVSSNILA